MLAANTVGASVVRRRQRALMKRRCSWRLLRIFDTEKQITTNFWERSGTAGRRERMSDTTWTKFCEGGNVHRVRWREYSIQHSRTHDLSRSIKRKRQNTQ